MNNHIDRPDTVRNGEGLDLKAVEAFLKDTIPGLEGRVTLAQYPSGASNLTYLITVGKRQMVLRRPPFGTKAATAHDMGREYMVLSALCDKLPYVPRPLAYTRDTSIIGCPFYVMERIEGIIIRKKMPEGLFTTPSQVGALFERFVTALNELHSLDHIDAALGELGKPEGYVRRQVTGWSKRYRAARTPDVPDFERVMEWLEEKIPPENKRACIIHNDFKFDNIVLDVKDPLKIVGVLDWEMCTLGDPLMDLGCTLGYWVEKEDPPERHIIRTMPTHVAGALSRKDFVEAYGRFSGLQMDDFDFYYCFGLFRLAVIIQQIYYRFYHGQTQNQRFGRFAKAVPVLEGAALQVMERSHL